MKVIFRQRLFALCASLTLLMVLLVIYFSFVLHSEYVHSEFEKGPLSLFFGAVGFLAAAAALVAPFYFLRYWNSRPRLIIGLISLKNEGEYFDRIAYDEVHFRQEKLACRFDDDISELKFQQKLNKVESHEIDLNSEGIGKVFIVLQNIGRRTVTNYTVVITLDSGVDIVGFESENLHPDSFYTHRRNLLNDDRLRSILPDQSVLEFYDGLYSGIHLEQSYIRFTDSLEGWGFETIRLTVCISPKLDKFRIFYRCDCPDIFPQRQLYAQQVSVLRPG